MPDRSRSYLIGRLDALTARGRAFGSWLREMAEDRPLISLLFACQIGFAAGRWGPRRAKP